MFSVLINSLINTIKKTFTVQGRATRLDYWTFVACYLLLRIILGLLVAGGFALHFVVGIIIAIPVIIIEIAGAICFITLSIRRLHDLGMTGFWLIYLGCWLPGLSALFVCYLLDIDTACNRMIEKTKNIGSPWLGWILTILAWFFGGAYWALIMLNLYKGKEEDNEFGPSPYTKPAPAPAPAPAPIPGTF